MNLQEQCRIHCTIKLPKRSFNEYERLWARKSGTFLLTRGLRVLYTSLRSTQCQLLHKRPNADNGLLQDSLIHPSPSMARGHGRRRYINA